ncbi:MAG: metallophosphoesterase family protein [Verrucomicrobiota bacterium]
MRRIVHISDLHFGRIHLPTLEPLVAAIHESQPHLVVNSGDFTQRARRSQFEEAALFMKKLPLPQVVVPGNHDIPFYKFFARFFWPLTNYRRFITDELFPFYHDEEIAVMGVSTARSLTTKNGRINAEQVARVREKMCGLDGIVKILVTHHPFDLPENLAETHLVGRAEMAMSALAECKVDLFLAGHLHVTHFGRTVERYKAHGYNSLFIQAGTATSTRQRAEPNSFNILDVDRSSLRVQSMVWDAEKMKFMNVLEKQFQSRAEGWFESSEGE